jgi:tRNA(adenine34) deaminase
LGVKKRDESWMRLALEEAALAPGHGDVPVGAVLVQGERVLARAHNERERTGDPTAHAEVLALRRASEVLGTWRLEGTELFVTVEPCPMCAGAAVAARVARVVYGCPDPKAGACHSLYSICSDPRLNHRAEVVGGVLSEEAASLLAEFFAARR